MLTFELLGLLPITMTDEHPVLVKSIRTILKAAKDIGINDNCLALTHGKCGPVLRFAVARRKARHHSYGTYSGHTKVAYFRAFCW
jgi:hypothetical protein